MRYVLDDGLKALLASAKIKKEDSEAIEEHGWISKADIVTLYKLALQNSEASKTTTVLDPVKLVVNAKVYKEPKKIPAKTPEFLAQMEALRMRQRELEYQKMVDDDAKDRTLSVMIEIEEQRKKGIDTDGLSVANMTKEVRRELTVVINMLVTLASVCYAVWYWSGTSTNMAVETRILWSIFFGLLALVAEVVLFGGYIYKIDEARAKERKKTDDKTLIETFTFGGPATPATPANKSAKSAKKKSRSAKKLKAH